MSKDKIFTEEELKQLGARTFDLLIEAIKVGDMKKSTGLGKRMYAEFLGMHDLYRDWVTHLLSFIGRRYGDEVLSEALGETVGGYTRRLARRYSNKNTKQKLEMLTGGLRGHLHPFEVAEEADKFIITATVCGSGGRLVKEGAYDRTDGFMKIKKPQPMTFDRADFPVYCAHCYFQNLSPAEPGGEPLFKTEPGEKIGDGPCKITVPK